MDEGRMLQGGREGGWMLLGGELEMQGGLEVICRVEDS